MIDSLVNKNNHSLYNKLILIIPEIKNIKEACKSKSDGFMDFNIDVLSVDKARMRIALSHYYKHDSGDMIADPDMEFILDLDNEWIEPVTYQDQYRYDVVYSDDYTKFKPELRKSLIEFSLMWFDNLLEQGHKIKC